MSRLRSSSLLLALALTLAACAETRVTDHALSSELTAVSHQRLGRTLLVIEVALPADQPERAVRLEEVSALIRTQLAPVTAAVVPSGPDNALLAQARGLGLDTVTVVRVEDYVRRGNLYLSLALPPVSWDTATTVSLRLRVLDVHSSTVIADLRRDRVRGGLFTLRSADDLPEELQQALRSLMVEG